MIVVCKYAISLILSSDCVYIVFFVDDISYFYVIKFIYLLSSFYFYFKIIFINLFWSFVSYLERPFSLILFLSARIFIYYFHALNFSS